MRGIRIRFPFFDKSAVPHGPHDKVFQASNSTQSNDEDVTAFPAPADLFISNEHSLLLPASPLPDPLLHLDFTATLIWKIPVIDERCCTGSLHPSLDQ